MYNFKGVFLRRIKLIFVAIKKMKRKLISYFLNKNTINVISFKSHKFILNYFFLKKEEEENKNVQLNYIYILGPRSFPSYIQLYMHT